VPLLIPIESVDRQIVLQILFVLKWKACTKLIAFTYPKCNKNEVLLECMSDPST